MDQFGEALDDGTWPILKDGSRAKCIPLVRSTPKRVDVKEYLETSMVNQIASKSLEIDRHLGYKGRKRIPER